MTTFIERLDSGSGRTARLAVKDLIDVAGVPTTAGCRAVAARAVPAVVDATCLAGARLADARIVGKTNLHELAFGATGINPWFGTPINPQDATLVPGGSSSGSAVAVANGEADVALGTDTAGSVRIPSACCATAALKTTFGRISTQGVWPLAPSLDTVGPMARDVAGLLLGMELLEPGFAVAQTSIEIVGRVRRPDSDPSIEAAIDEVLHAWGVQVIEVDLRTWRAATDAGVTILLGEAWRYDRGLLASDPKGITPVVTEALRRGSAVTDSDLDAARLVVGNWKAELRDAYGRVQLLALPTLLADPPQIGENPSQLATTTILANVGGIPALVLPVPRRGRLAASIQLLGPWGSEELLLAAGGSIEDAIYSR